MLKDSTIFDDSGVILEHYEFYKNGVILYEFKNLNPEKVRYEKRKKGLRMVWSDFIITGRSTNGRVLKITPYKSEEKHGPQQIFYNNGKLQKEVLYGYGKEIRVQLFQ